MGGKGKKRGAHPKKPKTYRSPETYRKFRAYIHIRTPKGKRATRKSETISGVTPKHRKEKVVIIGKRRHRPKLT